MDNAFAVALAVSPSAVLKIERTRIYGAGAKKIFALSPQGYEAGHLNNKVFPVVNSIYNYYKGNFNINVWPMVDYYPLPEEIKIHIQFGTPIPSSQLIPPYNPFLVPDLKRLNEIHLINHPPTELMNNKILGTGDDRSESTKGIYYMTTNNLPWVIEIPVSFNYTIVKADILKGYLKYAEWALSGGTKSKDWYLDKPGYRNTNYIYKKP